MNTFTICNLIEKINNLLWGAGTFLIVAVIGLIFTIRIKYANIIHIVHFFKIVFKGTQTESGSHQKGNISHFQALSTALAASMGTGNIIGVAAAISIGGPGAIFWMWVSAILGTSIGFIENTLGHIYQINKSGPMGYISKAFRSERAALLYAMICIAASFGIGNITQSNAISAAASEFNVPPHISGIFVALLLSLIICGGIKKVSLAAEKLVPFAAAFYLIGAIIVIAFYGNYISEILIIILKSAMGFDAVAGGFLAAIFKKSIAVGLRRGIFSNEAGLGSSVLIHSETDAELPVKMGMFAVVEIVIDTLFCCTATAFVILLTGANSCGTTGLAMVTTGFSSVMGSFAPFFVSSTTIIFAFCTLLGWYFYGEKCLNYAVKTGNSGAVFFYRFLYISASFAGAVAQLQLVWEISDLLNWFMLVINLSAVVILHNDAVKEINDYTKSIK